MDRSAFVHSGIHPAAGFVFSAFATVALLLFPGAVQAAPQSLGLVATTEPVPMICDEDGCVVQLSSFCLQGDRKSPNFNTPYHVDGGTGLWLHLTDADGGHRTIPAEGLARFVSIRGYTAVEANVSTSDMADLGAVAISVEVGKLVTLFPEAIPGDPNPITPEEVAFAKGEARRLAASIFDSTEGLGHTISIIDRSINSLTSMSRLSDEERRDLWSRVAGAPLDTEPDARTRGAAQMFSECLDDLRRKMVFGLRNCLEGRRDEVLIRANVTLWNGLGTGS
jgi:hypothetical protein